MEDTTSEATSSYLSSQMVYDTMDDPIIDADPCNFQQHTNGVVAHSQANQYQLIQGEPSNASDQPRARGCRAKLTEAQRRVRKRQSDVKHRQNKREKLNELSAENKGLQEDNRQLTSANRNLQEENSRLITENRRLQEENSRLSTKNRCLEEENGKLIVENRRLEEHVGGPQSRMMHPAENGQRQDSYIYQPTGHLDHQNVYAQDHLRMESGTEGAALDGLEINDLRSLLLPQTNQNGVAHESASEHPETSLSSICHDEMDVNKFLMKLDEDVLSEVDLKDFTGIEGEWITFGRYSFPLSLIPTFQKISDVHGDVSATSLINPSVAGTIYVLFCATIKEMDDLQLEQVIEKKIFKWRDTIKDALRIKFNVSFAMEHLKKIARAYFGLIGHLLLQSIDERISELEAEVNNWKMKRAETYKGSISCIDAAQEFTGVPVSTGLFP